MIYQNSIAGFVALQRFIYRENLFSNKYHLNLIVHIFLNVSYYMLTSN